RGYDRVSRRPGRRVGVRAPAVRVGGGDPRARGLRHAGRGRHGEPGAHPRHVAAVQTCRGSHTHTLVPDPRDSSVVYVYVQGTSQVRPAAELAGCSGLAPEQDPNTALFRIEIIRVPLDAPQDARIVNMPRLFADPAT